MSTVTLAAQAVAKAALTGVPVSSIVTSDPARFVRVTRIGGPRERFLDRARILVECYGSKPSGSPDTGWAENAATTLADAFQAASNGGPWAGLWVTDWAPDSLSDYANPDYPKHARFQFTGTLFVLRS
ncbi:tail terminator [Gordonia phage PhorbesPhlower]|nr:tail terminator [Gordonia phage PhorbesPhlower]UUG69872.1 tail terminator [Gordonia phage Morkie]